MAVQKTAFVKVERKFYLPDASIAQVGAVVELPRDLAAEMVACGRGSAHGGPAAPAPKAKGKSAENVGEQASA